MVTTLTSNDADTGTLEELCQRCDIGISKGYELARENRFPVPVFRIGRTFRFSRRAWDALMAAQHADDSDQAA